jgi:hypothetical protein
VRLYYLCSRIEILTFSINIVSVTLLRRFFFLVPPVSAKILLSLSPTSANISYKQAKSRGFLHFQGFVQNSIISALKDFPVSPISVKAFVEKSSKMSNSDLENVEQTIPKTSDVTSFSPSALEGGTVTNKLSFSNEVNWDSSTDLEEVS